MTHTIHSKMVRTLYRSLLRQARRVDQGHGTLNSVLGMVTLPAGKGRGQPSAKDIVRHNFRSHAKYPAASEDTTELVDLALSALRTINRTLSAEKASHGPGVPAVPVGKPSDVAFSVGHVIRHKAYGYKGVIVGWHKACSASAEWMTTNGIQGLPHGPAQPFYYVLVDVGSRPDAQVSYVAQDHIELMSGGLMEGGQGMDAAARLVIHPLITRYFAQYRPVEGVYVPNESLATQYPLDSPLGTLAPARLQATHGAGQGSPDGRSRDDGGDRSPRASRSIRGSN